MKKLSILFLVFVGLMAFTLPAKASTLTFGFDHEFSGGTAPAGETTPWLTATFDDDTGNPNSVSLTMSASGLVDTEFVNDWLFNFTGDPTQLSFAFVEGSAGAANNVNTGVDAFKADGDGKFDIEFDFPPPPGKFDYKFTTGEVAVYDITYTSAIDVTFFDVVSATGGGQGKFKAAAHVKGICEEDSGWIAPNSIPDPASVFLLGPACLIGFAGLRRKFKM